MMTSPKTAVIMQHESQQADNLLFHTLQWGLKLKFSVFIMRDNLKFSAVFFAHFSCQCFVADA